MLFARLFDNPMGLANPEDQMTSTQLKPDSPKQRGEQALFLFSQGDGKATSDYQPFTKLKI
jgi:hypothetical protein